MKTTKRSSSLWSSKNKKQKNKCCCNEFYQSMIDFWRTRSWLIKAISRKQRNGLAPAQNNNKSNQNKTCYPEIPMLSAHELHSRTEIDGEGAEDYVVLEPVWTSLSIWTFWVPSQNKMLAIELFALFFGGRKKGVCNDFSKSEWVFNVECLVKIKVDVVLWLEIIEFRRIMWILEVEKNWNRLAKNWIVLKLITSSNKKVQVFL